jgi:hypothetical protein
MVVAAVGANLLSLLVLCLAIDLLSFAPAHRATLHPWLLRTPQRRPTGVDAPSAPTR